MFLKSAVNPGGMMTFYLYTFQYGIHLSYSCLTEVFVPLVISDRADITVLKAEAIVIRVAIS